MKFKTLRLQLFLLLVIFLTCFVTACKEKEPKIDDKIVSTYIELKIIEYSYGKDSPTGRISRQNILKKNNYDRESFEKEIDLILNNENLWIPFQKAVVEKIDTLLSKKDSVISAQLRNHAATNSEHLKKTRAKK